MTDLEECLTFPAFAWSQETKRPILLRRLRDLTQLHYKRNEKYRNIVDNVFGGLRKGLYEKIEDIPFLPVSLFKRMELRSVPEDQVIKVLTSSGTTGSSVSRIYLDQHTAKLQAKVLVKIFQHSLGRKRLPMVIVDHPDVIRNRASFSARGAGIMGMIQFGRKPIYALDSEMKLDFDKVAEYLSAHKGENVLFFGFTFMVWKHLVQELRLRGATLPVENGILVHSGGWKKLESEKVSAINFADEARETCGVSKVINFYGMVEQVGSVFIENSLHHLNAPIYSDVIVREPKSLKILPQGEEGLIQVVSMLPESYPGHSILTEDMGVIEGCDSGSDGMNGTYFRITGRVPKTELRGCSDTYASEHDD